MLRGVAMMSDAISHAILLGIVVMFLFVQQFNITVADCWCIMRGNIDGVVHGSDY